MFKPKEKSPSVLKIYLNLVKELPDSTIQITKKPHNWVEIKSAKAVFNIVGAAPEEFPAFPQYETKDFARIQGEIIRDMIEKTLYSVSNDETRYHLNGVYFEKSFNGRQNKF